MSGQEISGNREAHSFRIKMAALVTGINVILTVIKFALYFFSGSLAILAEAWHSFSDIVTSLLVFIALLKAKHICSQDIDPSRCNKKNSTELIISLGIGIMLSIIAGSLIFKFATVESRTIENSLVSGLFFLVFSFVSYFIYRFEIRIGEEVNSIGLVSDGMHSRADMIASLITGFALILYTVGLNLDRWVSLLIALFVLAFAIETITNVVMAFFRGGKDPFHRYRFSRVFFVLFDKNAFHEKSKGIQSFIEERFEFKRLKRITNNTLRILAPAVVIAIFLSSVFFKVGINEKAVVERFGRPVGLAETIDPGLHIKWPWPVDRVIRQDATIIKSMYIGNIVSDNSLVLLWTKSHGTEETFLSGDNNFFYPYIVVHYRIRDLFQYLYKTLDPEKTVNEIAHQIAVCLILIYLFSGIYSISSNEVGILQRFGKVVESGIQPGIHFALPWPVDRITKVPIKAVNRILIDDFSSETKGEDSASGNFSEMTGLDSYCLTGDNNLVNIMCVIQYNIIDPVKYIFSVSSPELILKNMACNTIVRCLAGMTIDEALTSGKQGMVYDIKKELQKRLDETDSGMGVSFIEISSINPPERVQDVFSDVVRANIDQEKMINDAESYRNEMIPAANANAARILEEAEAYGKEAVLTAEGDTERFLNLLEQKKIQGDSARKMIYLETITDVMKTVGVKKIMVRDENEDNPARLILNSSND